MTTSTFSASAETPLPEEAATTTAAPQRRDKRPGVELVHTLASRFVVLLLCAAIVLSTLAYGTVHYWALAVFQGGAALIIIFWSVDAWRSHHLRLSLNVLQVPLAGLLLIGFIQLLPLGASAPDTAGLLTQSPVHTLSLDPYSTRLTLIQLIALVVYFAAALSFIDSPKRLRLVVRTVLVFGFALAIFGLIQSYTSPNKVYWIRELPQAAPFGPFINRHHFAGYMEMTLGLALGLLLTGAVEREKRLLYIFAAAMMAIALVMTNSRGGIISLVAEIFFLVLLTGFGRRSYSEEETTDKSTRVRTALVRVSLALGIVIALFAGVVLLGGESALSRFVGTVNADDPTTGRAHFWSTSIKIIEDHPVIGVGLGAFSLAYTRYDTRNGLFRLEQAHNDYLQVLTDAGILGALCGLFFIGALFRMGLQRRESTDIFRRGVATGALAGCFAVLVHSFFDFTLHTTSNALLFLVLAALATVGGRVELPSHGHRRRRRRPTVPQPSLPRM
jgi:O-antigen ligase